MIRAAFFSTLLAILTVSRPAAAHCDTTRGPVVTDARAALEAGDPRLVLHWVRPEDEPEVLRAFEQTVHVRTQGGEAKALADHYFFETVIRIHRAGEGAPYTGITDEQPAAIIGATDTALAQGSAADLERLIVAAVREQLDHRFSTARAQASFERGDVTAGRAFVAAYVGLTHWVEGVFAAAHGGHEEDPAASAAGHTAGAHHVQGGAHGTTAAADEHRSVGHSVFPWLVVAVLAAVALVEGMLLLRGKRVSTV